jgi:hypothetical protein
MDHVGSPSEVALDDYLGVRIRAETMAFRFKRGADLLEVVDLAVEHQRDFTIGGEHWLVGRGG